MGSFLWYSLLGYRVLFSGYLFLKWYIIYAHMYGVNYDISMPPCMHVMTAWRWVAYLSPHAFIIFVLKAFWQFSSTCFEMYEGYFKIFHGKLNYKVSYGWILDLVAKIPANIPHPISGHQVLCPGPDFWFLPLMNAEASGDCPVSWVYAIHLSDLDWVLCSHLWHSISPTTTDICGVNQWMGTLSLFLPPFRLSLFSSSSLTPLSLLSTLFL